ncbi:MAG: hypothetical protein IKO41_00485 [Lachnospiraceae bacterium]|nr:hypothetical protein [Lachnospiraceae bacterium]
MILEQETGNAIPFLENFSDAFYEWKDQRLFRLSELQEKLEELKSKHVDDPVAFAQIRMDMSEIEMEILCVQRELDNSHAKLRLLLDMVSRMTRDCSGQHSRKLTR